MNLEQDKLDVRVKNRANLFNWRGQFTPELIEYILRNFAPASSKVLDPFSGSGTVLLESARRDLECHGCEINPAAYTMSKFFSFTNLTFKQRLEFLTHIEVIFGKALKNVNGLPLYRDSQDYRYAYKNLIDFGQELIQKIEREDHKVFFTNMLFLSEKDKNLTLKTSVTKSFSYLKNALLGLPYTSKRIDSTLADARSVVSMFHQTIDLVVTSPPYINVFNYHQNYRGLVEIFGINLLKVAHSEFGSNRKNRGNRFRTVVQYCLDIEGALNSFWHSLKPDGTMILVVGRESNVRKTPFYNGSIVRDILSETRGFKEIKNFDRAFVNKFGEIIKEDIIVAKKGSSIEENPVGYLIAAKHLTESLLKCSEDSIRQDLEEAIANLHSIEPSPIFDANDIF